eukprot:CAMPEP_0195109106 /NCGR_PEP_ID=MMETSP0448-20130528/88275_1 /TAXON_ID=66468 /ORGANISM="Heterocapsa triquestra, Strain CCMP 448" /LENGTH=260 /DNA_ID=CAMNT_0040145707 /DNA_START=234 /DNA_END=1017 /DNA_ORIENTATION=-
MSGSMTAWLGPHRSLPVSAAAHDKGLCFSASTLDYLGGRPAVDDPVRRVAAAGRNLDDVRVLVRLCADLLQRPVLHVQPLVQQQRQGTVAVRIAVLAQQVVGALAEVWAQLLEHLRRGDAGEAHLAHRGVAAEVGVALPTLSHHDAAAAEGELVAVEGDGGVVRLVACDLETQRRGRQLHSVALRRARLRHARRARVAAHGKPDDTEDVLGPAAAAAPRPGARRAHAAGRSGLLPPGRAPSAGASALAAAAARDHAQHGL